MSLDDLLLTLKAGKGNWGHGGRPGKRGGSTPRTGAGAYSKEGEKQKRIQRQEGRFNEINKRFDSLTSVDSLEVKKNGKTVEKVDYRFDKGAGEVLAKVTGDKSNRIDILTAKDPNSAKERIDSHKKQRNLSNKAD